MGSNICLKVISVIVALGSAIAGQKDHDPESEIRIGYLNKIPRKFELKGENAGNQFQRYANEIKRLADKNDIKIKYRINVESSAIPNTKKSKKALPKKNKSKKYNVPLKKKSLKLSSFELYLRKAAEEHGKNAPKHVEYTESTTNKELHVVNTKVPSLKFKPIISRVRTNYTKIIKPVRSKIVTINV